MIPTKNKFIQKERKKTDPSLILTAISKMISTHRLKNNSFPFLKVKVEAHSRV